MLTRREKQQHHDHQLSQQEQRDHHQKINNTRGENIKKEKNKVKPN